jgi:hypothetical protein
MCRADMTAMQRIADRRASVRIEATPDRRRCPDRRSKWRGGRRDTDWTCRPAGASWTELEPVVRTRWWTPTVGSR